MALAFKLDRILSDHHHDELRELLLDRRRTINDAHTWVKARGYRVCRTAVSNYRRRLNQDRLIMAARSMGIINQNHARQVLRRCADRLAAADLLTLALFGMFLERLAALAAEPYTGPSRHRTKMEKKQRRKQK